MYLCVAMLPSISFMRPHGEPIQVVTHLNNLQQKLDLT